MFSLFRKVDEGALDDAVSKGSYQEFIALYSRRHANTFYIGRPLLGSALTNPNISARIAIVNRLLDDGAAVDDGSAMTSFLTTHQHDFGKEAPLLQRMLDAGAPVNIPYGKWGTPLIALATTFRFAEAELAPFYDVFFARHDLDLSTKEGLKRNISTYLQIQKIAQLRPDLLRRADLYLKEQRLEKPDDAQTDAELNS